MCRGLLGKKLGMTKVFTPRGVERAVTVLQVGPCVVTQVKTAKTDGYDALQLGFGDKKASTVNKPAQGHLKKSGAEGCAMLKEFAVKNPSDYSPGQKLNVSMFKPGDMVDVSGTVKGRGFSGVIKRHGFARGRKTHGSKSYRLPGSIGCSAWPARVFKGKKLPGHYGVFRKTVRNMQVVDIRGDEDIMLVAGAVPGAKSGYVEINRPKFEMGKG